MKTTKILTIIKILVLSFLFTSCVKDTDFELPEIGQNAPPFTGTIKSLSDVVAQSSTSVKTYEANDAIEGYVISSDEGGNFYQKIYVQTLDGSDAFTIAVEKGGLFGEYPVGTKVQVRMKNLSTVLINNKLEVGYEVYKNDFVGKIPPGLYPQHIIVLKGGADPKMLAKSSEDISELAKDENLNLLLTFKNVSFDKNAVGKTFHLKENDKIYGTNYNIFDANGNSVPFRTSRYAKYTTQKVPKELANITGILTKYRNDYQFLIRSINDIEIQEGTTGNDPGSADAFTGKIIPLSELTAMASDKEVKNYTENSALEGYVISSDEGGSFYQKVYVQTLDGKDGFTVSIKKKNLYEEYPVGSKVQVRLKGLSYNINNGKVDIGQGVYKEKFVGKIADGVYQKYVINLNENVEESKLIKEFATVGELNFEENLNVLLKLNDLVFEDSAIGKTYHQAKNDKQYGTNYKLKDASGKYVTFRTSKFAKHKNEIVPADHVNVVGILTKYRNTYQFEVRTLADITILAGTAGTGGATSDVVLKTLPFDEGFSAEKLPEGWKSAKVKGDREWQKKSYSGKNYMQMSAYSKTGTLDVETWLITPQIDLAGATNAVLKIKLADAFQNGNPLRITYSTDYDGKSEITTATWKEIGAEIVAKLINNKGKYDNKYEESEGITIPESGKVFVAFIYDSKGGTISTTVQLENVAINTEGSTTGGNTGGESGETTGSIGAKELFFSEYAEGSSNNKYIEIYNPTDKEVDLSSYKVELYGNGKASATGVYEFPAGAKLGVGKTYVIYNANANADIKAKGNADSKVTWFNGDDALGLLKDGELIDVVGKKGEKKKWAVAGVNNATSDHTLIRKANIMKGNTDWASSAGTSVEDSEWIVKEKDDFSSISVR